MPNVTWGSSASALGKSGEAAILRLCSELDLPPWGNALQLAIPILDLGEQ
jgi:hypothetical protein